MAAIHVREIPPETLAALKRRAAAHHRSLQMELREILERAADEAPMEAPLRSISEELTMATNVAPSHDMWSRDSLYDDDGR